MKEPGGPLFLIALWDPKHPGKELNIPNWFNTTVDIVVDAQKATSFEYSQEIKDGKAVLTLKYRGIPVRTQPGLVDVTVTVSLADGSGLFEWGLSISNATSLQLYEVHFPILQGLASGIPGSETKDYVAVSSYCGGEKKPLPRSVGEIGQGGGEYPGIGVQLLSYCDGLGGALYFASHDPAAYRKTFIYQPCAQKRRSNGMSFTMRTSPGSANGNFPIQYSAAPSKATGTTQPNSTSACLRTRHGSRCRSVRTLLPGSAISPSGSKATLLTVRQSVMGIPKTG